MANSAWIVGLNLAIMAFTAPAWSAGKNCERLLKYAPVSKSAVATLNTTHLIAYLGDLLKSRAINHSALLDFAQALQKGEVINPISEAKSETSSALTIHREGLAKLIRGGHIDLERIRNWLRQTLSEQNKIQNDREEVMSGTKIAHLGISFAPVPPASFRMGDEESRSKTFYNVELTNAIEVMSTLLTQKQWVDLFGENPSHFAQGQGSIEIQGGEVERGGKKIRLRPDNPVENITWWSAITAANKLSQIHGLKPAYDTSHITWKKDTKPEDGSLERESGELKINAPNGDIYSAEGYRLPTEAEQEYLLRLEQTQNGHLKLKTRAWNISNSDGTTHPVSELVPLRIDGAKSHLIYDLFGNVWEWSHDWQRSGIMGGKNPAGPVDLAINSAFDKAFPPPHSVRGGAFDIFEEILRPGYRSEGQRPSRQKSCGVRFVRTLNALTDP